MPRANRRCPTLGCDHTHPCPAHPSGPWASSTRRATLPRDWPAIRRTVLERDPVCQLHYSGSWQTPAGATTGCAGTAVEVDHIGDADDHRPHMLRGVCTPCHKRRTAEQARDARRRQ